MTGPLSHQDPTSVTTDRHQTGSNPVAPYLFTSQARKLGLYDATVSQRV